jgi:hypothetical protein
VQLRLGMCIIVTAEFCYCAERAFMHWTRNLKVRIVHSSAESRSTTTTTTLTPSGGRCATVVTTIKKLKDNRCLNVVACLHRLSKCLRHEQCCRVHFEQKFHGELNSQSHRFRQESLKYKNSNLIHFEILLHLF